MLGPEYLDQFLCVQVLDSLYNSIHDNAVEHYHAFYSSELQGITTDPGLMLVHMDDHLVHRGHAVFDTAVIVDGFLYQLSEHLQRFQHSAEVAGLILPYSIEQTHRIICETAAASKQINGEPPGKQSLPFLYINPWQPFCGWLLSQPSHHMVYPLCVLLCQHLPSVSICLHWCNMLCYFQRM